MKELTQIPNIDLKKKKKKQTRSMSQASQEVPEVLE